jgi:mannose-1-phosphate guanylyltransferase
LNDHLYGVIMAGGIGSRLWPRSRLSSPKQFQDLVSPRSMLQETVERIRPLIPLRRLLVVTGEDQVPLVHSQIPELPADNVLAEPGPRGTAPCIGLAAVAIGLRDAEATMAIFPADHCIADTAGFRRAISAADRLAQDDYLVTLGVTPGYPHTGYGYIQRGEGLTLLDGQPAYRVRRFAEKPDATTARAFLESGEYYWNAGIFIWRTARILEEIALLLPNLHAALEEVAAAWGSPTQHEILQGTYGRVEPTTIDYGVMERARRAAVLPVEIGWDDVGNWEALSRLVSRDEQGNTASGQGHNLLMDTSNTYVYAATGRLVALVGMEDMVVIDTPDALLVCPKDRAQAVRDVVERLKANGLQQYL